MKKLLADVTEALGLASDIWVVLPCCAYSATYSVLLSAGAESSPAYTLCRRFIDTVLRNMLSMLVNLCTFNRNKLFYCLLSSICSPYPSAPFPAAELL
jgi:hypothetical protein